MKLTKLIATATTAAVLAMAGVSIAGAATTSSSGSPKSSTSVSATGNRATRRAHLRNLAKEGVVLAAKTIGIKPAELAQEMRAGKTIADVATENGVLPSTVVTTLVNAADKRIETALANGKLTTDQATALKDKVPAAVDKLVNNPHVKAADAAQRRAIRRDVIKGGVKIAAATIGIKPPELVQEVRTGKTIADVATEHSVLPSTVVTALVNAADKRIETALANGKLTTDQATALKNKVPAAVDKLVNDWHPKA
jgi:DNA recombination-dependent growth factor C